MLWVEAEHSTDFANTEYKQSPAIKTINTASIYSALQY